MSKFNGPNGESEPRFSPRALCTVLAVCCTAALAFGAWQFSNLSQAHQAADAAQDKTAKAPKPADDVPKLEPERVNFRPLILGNPNAFGNLKDSELKPIVPNFALSNTTYEEIRCVGYNPQFSRLEAVVHIKQTGGYGGELCQAGTPEYVRFFVDWDNNGTWTDEGVVSFIVHDVPGPKPLEYDATLPISPRMKFCPVENLPKVRAILSWDNPPPANAPTVPPVWGNVIDARIQIRPRNLIILSDLLKEAKVANLKDLEGEVDLDQQLAAPKPKEMTPAELQAKYKDKVPEHRFLYPLLAPLVANPDATTAALAPGSKGLFPELGVDIGKIIGTIQKTDGDTTFEQLKCIGLNANQSTLVGVFTVKKPSGYSGNLCSPGSQEYVAFWLDWGSGFTYAGTTSVAVHDLQNIPQPEGLQYAVELPVNLSAHQQPCYDGPATARVRAILSWQVAPPAGNPNFTPVWGNRMESTLLVNPGPKAPGQDPFLSAVGDIPEININSSGTATGSAIHTGFVCSDSPFGGRITVAGHISNPAPGMRYRVMKKPHGAADSAYSPLGNDFDQVIDSWSPGTGWIQFHQTAHPVNGYYTFEDYSPNHAVEGNLMGVWWSNADEDGNTYDLRIDLNTDGNPLHDKHSNVVTILVDNRAPDVDLSITLAMGVQCSEFPQGAKITGSYRASDLHFGSFSFVIQPSGPPHDPPHGTLPVPPAGSHGIINPPGLSNLADPGILSGVYNLDTSKMDPCGYSLTLYVSDRTNVNSGQTSNTSSRSVGFCLKKP
jgi:hypothetical protein